VSVEPTTILGSWRGVAKGTPVTTAMIASKVAMGRRTGPPLMKTSEAPQKQATVSATAAPSRPRRARGRAT